MVLEQGYSVADAAKSLGVSTSLLYNWKEKHTCGNRREGWYSTVTEARNIPVSNSVGCSRVMVSAPAWVMWGRVGIMPLLSVSLVA